LSAFYTATHLVETGRINLAMDYFVHEFAKILPLCSHQEIRDSLKAFAPTPETGETSVRDFWNLFCALSSGWCLKDIYVQVTAENVRWELTRISLDQLVPSEADMGWMAYVRPYSLPKALEYLRAGYLDEAEQQTSINRAGRHIEDGNDPLIGLRMIDGRVLVQDGNGRLKAQVEVVAKRQDDDGLQSEMAVWVGSGSGDPYNYWIPTNCMFLLARFVAKPVEIDSVLASRSPIAANEFAERVLPHV
jgi:hypothetical protein